MIAPRRTLLLAFLLACFVAGCGRTRATDVDELSILVGRCIRLRQPIFLVDSGQRNITSDVFLSSASREADAVRGAIAAGTTLTVTRVVHKKSFEFSHVEVIAAQAGGTQVRIDASRAFKDEWLESAHDVANGEKKATRRMVETSLDPLLAEWCSDKSITTHGTMIGRRE